MRVRLAIVLMTAASLVTLAPSARAATATPSWAPAATAAVHPGVQTLTAGAQCTADFVFTDGVDVFIGQAAHCAGTGAATDTNGCVAKSLPLGTKVDITGATQPGVLVYSSWLTMQARHEKDAETCAYNDIGLVRLDRRDRSKVNPSVPHWGGPVALGGPTQFGDPVFSYGNSELRAGISQLSPKQGYSLGDSPGGWDHTVYTVTPGIPGDSGSAFLDGDGKAIGVLSTIDITPTPAANEVVDLAHMLGYLHTHSTFTAVQLARGTQAFTPPLVY
ncbi:MAG: hypothetical protein QOI47_1471 [Actinomycetota bacterium]|jgi:hypothetical protein|nr:hypothetical protein [Actinomycetota bacterium]